MADCLVEFNAIGKTFLTPNGEIQALSDVSLKVVKGTIHAILGENGAGKSTLMKILFGLYKPSSGDIFFEGKKIKWKNALEARAYGLGMVHQHFMLAESESALDNICLYFLDHFSKNGWMNRSAVIEKLKELEVNTGLKLNWNQKVNELSVGEQQRLEIIKAILFPTKILILDEPTAVLSPTEIESLLSRMVELKNQGVTILLISHKLKEVMKVADEVSILRGGKLVGSSMISDLTEESLAQLMIGHKIPSLYQKEKVESPTSFNIQMGETTVAVASGEILGVAGVEGNGQDAMLLKLIEKDWGGAKVARLAPDRLRQSVVMSMSLAENLLLKKEMRENFNVKGFIHFERLKEFCSQLSARNDVRPNIPDALVENLSGGNQQKFVVGRELDSLPMTDLAFVCHPTRGVDLAASQNIRNKIIQLRNQGAAIVLMSSDVGEILNLSDRVVVIEKNKVKGPFIANALDETRIGLLMGGVDA